MNDAMVMMATVFLALVAAIIVDKTKQKIDWEAVGAFFIAAFLIFVVCYAIFGKSRFEGVPPEQIKDYEVDRR